MTSYNHTEPLDHNPQPHLPSDPEDDEILLETQKQQEQLMQEEKKEEEEEPAHKLEECELETEYNDQGEIVFKGYPTVTLKVPAVGEGQFCEVFKAIGVYEDFDNLTVNYAFKVYKKKKLQNFVANPEPD